jgi:hypothetical protein
MGTASLTREQLNEAIEQIANKIMEALGANVTDEETTSEPELTGTRFKATNLNGDMVELDAEGMGVGALVADGAFEYFRCLPDDTIGPWVRYSGQSYSHEEFAAEMRDPSARPRIVHEG